MEIGTVGMGALLIAKLRRGICVGRACKVKLTANRIDEIN